MICYQSNGCMLWLEGLGDNENRPEVFNLFNFLLHRACERLNRMCDANATQLLTHDTFPKDLCAPHNMLELPLNLPLKCQVLFLCSFYSNHTESV